MSTGAAKRVFVWALVAECVAAATFPLTVWVGNPRLLGGERAFGAVVYALYLNGVLVGLSALVGGGFAFAASRDHHLAIRLLLAGTALSAGPLLLYLTMALFVRYMGW